MVSALHQHESAIGIYVRPVHPEPPFPDPPSRLSQSTGFRCPASGIERTLLIYFT